MKKKKKKDSNAAFWGGGGVLSKLKVKIQEYVNTPLSSNV